MIRMASLLSFAVVTLMAAAVGGAFGLQMAPKLVKMVESQAAHGSPAHHIAHALPKDAQLQPLPPVIVNLASPDRVWLRLEGSILLDRDQAKDGAVLAGQMAQDLAAFLKTVSLPQIQGPSGFQHLREDLNDRVRLRSGGKIRELFIQTLVFE